MVFRIFFAAVVLLPLYADEPRMVDLNVVALDNHGQPVTDLSRDELRITDSGKNQAIAFFHHRDAVDRAAVSVGPNEFTNRCAHNVPRGTVILFDMLNERFGTRGATEDRLLHDVGSLESADYVYLYLLTLDGRLYAVHGLPGPEGAPGPPGGTPWTRELKPLLDKALRTVLMTRPVDIDEAVRVQLTFRAMDMLAGELASVPGRKSIVWLTDGVPIELGPRRSDTGDWVDFTPLLRQMSDAFDRSAVAIYPVRQIMLGSPDNIDGANRDGMASIQTLDTFAGLTGGRPDAGKDVGAAVKQAMMDMRTSYQVGYYPAEKNWDDKFHKVRVTCTRKGVKIQAKTGYYAWKNAPGAKSEQAVNSAVGTRFDASEIGLRARLLPLPAKAGKQAAPANTAAQNPGRPVRLQAHIDARDVVLVQQGDQYQGQLRLAIVGYTANRMVQRGPLMPLDVHYSSQERDKVLQQGIEFAQNLSLGEDVAVVRLIVLDRGSSEIGSVTIPVEAAIGGKQN